MRDTFIGGLVVSLGIGAGLYLGLSGGPENSWYLAVSAFAFSVLIVVMAHTICEQIARQTDRLLGIEISEEERV